MSFADRMAHSELPRRVLGAVLSVLVPGAGHVVIGYPTVGWIVAGASLALGAAIIACAIATATTAFLALGAVYILGSVASVVSIFALPPGPRLKDGLRALWPVLVLLPLFRGAAYLVRTYLLIAHIATDGAMGPGVVKGDLVLVYPGTGAEVGDVALVEHPRGSGTLWLRRIKARSPERLEVAPDDVKDAAAASPAGALTPADLRGRALFVFMAARDSDGRGRIWKPLSGGH